MGFFGGGGGAFFLNHEYLGFFFGGGGGVAVFEIMYNLILKSNNILIHAYGIKIQKWINTYVSILYCYSFTDV